MPVRSYILNLLRHERIRGSVFVLHCVIPDLLYEEWVSRWREPSAQDLEYSVLRKRKVLRCELVEHLRVGARRRETGPRNFQQKNSFDYSPCKGSHSHMPSVDTRSQSGMTTINNKKTLSISRVFFIDTVYT
jgi:hypothetical protein